MDAEGEIRRRIEDQGRITFADFMEVALYWPVGGFYSSRHLTGPHDNFYTAARAHPAFAALLSLQLFQFWQLLEHPHPFWVVEMGGADGLLARDILDYCAHLPGAFRDALSYLCLDRSQAPGGGDDSKGLGRDDVQRITSAAVPFHGIVGCFLSNELVDAFPVHRVTMAGGQLREVYVTVRDGELVEEMGEPSTPALREHMDQADNSLEEGSTAEVNLAAVKWVEGVSDALERGFVLTIDYGGSAQELSARAGARGTLRCYYRHMEVVDPYTRIGDQDITSHVDFTSLALQGQKHGLEEVGYVTQGQFLRALGLNRLTPRLRAEGLNQGEVEANSMGMLDLARQGGMGDFKVLVQGKKVGAPSLWGIDPTEEAASLLDSLPLPLRSQSHIPLLEGRYTHAGQDWSYDGGGQPTC